MMLVNDACCLDLDIFGHVATWMLLGSSVTQLFFAVASSNDSDAERGAAELRE